MALFESSEKIWVRGPVQKLKEWHDLLLMKMSGKDVDLDQLGKLLREECERRFVGVAREVMNPLWVAKHQPRLWRLLREEEDPDEGLLCKDFLSATGPISHCSGTKPTAFISTAGADGRLYLLYLVCVTRNKNPQAPLKAVGMWTKRLIGGVLPLYADELRETFGINEQPLAKSNATNASEVLVFAMIPQEAIAARYDFGKAECAEELNKVVVLTPRSRQLLRFSEWKHRNQDVLKDSNFVCNVFRQARC